MYGLVEHRPPSIYIEAQLDSLIAREQMPRPGMRSTGTFKKTKKGLKLQLVQNQAEDKRNTGMESWASPVFIFLVLFLDLGRKGGRRYSNAIPTTVFSRENSYHSCLHDIQFFKKLFCFVFFFVF